MADVERVHAEDAGDSGMPLLQSEPGQPGDAKFLQRHFEYTNLHVRLRRADLF